MTRERTILVVDDDEGVRQILQDLLASVGYRTVFAGDGEEALLRLENGDVDLVVSDDRMPGMSGRELLWECVRRWPGLPVVLLTGYGNVPDAVEAIKAGAEDYLLKPFDGRDLLRRITSILQVRGDLVWRGGRNLLAEELWGGKSPAMQRLCKLIERVAPTEATVLLLGESGTGKEKIAGLLHRLSLRAALASA